MQKIAFPTEDNRTICQHFGRATGFTVASVDDAGNVSLEHRDKSYHGQHDEQQQHDAHEHHQTHGRMLAPIADCQILIAGGMGQPAYDHAVAVGLEVIMTGERAIESALAAFRSGGLISDMRRVHASHHGPSTTVSLG